MTNDSLRIPAALRYEVEQILEMTGRFSTEHLDAEYGELIRKLVAKLARKRPSPLSRGDLRIWAAAAIHVVGSVNFLFDRTQRPHLTVDDLSRLTGVPKSTIASKAKRIRDTLRVRPMDPDFCTRKSLASNPMAWAISVNGFIVDARTMPPEIQAEARRRGFIPDLPVESEAGVESEEGTAGAGPTEGDASEKGVAEGAQDVIGILRSRPAFGSEGSNGSDAWDSIVRIVAQEGSLPDGGVKVIEEAIAEAYDGWSDAQRRSIWYETDSGMTDDDDDESMCNTSFNGIGYALQVEMLGEVTRVAWQDAEELRKAGKRSARKRSRGAEQGL